MVPPADSLPQSRQYCRFCKEPIHVGAVYCKTCEQFQTAGARWRNGMTFSALISALPLLALIYSFIQDHTVRTRSEVHALPLRCGTETMVVGLTNSGNRPGIVSGGLIRRAEDGHTTDWPLTNLAKEGAMVVEPGKQVIAPFGIGGGALGQPPTGRSAGSCTYMTALDVLEFSERTPRKEMLSCACPVA